MKGYIKPLVTFAMLSIFAADGMAESHAISNRGSDGYRASARIKLHVVIPGVLQFQISDTTPGADALTFPTPVTAPTAGGSIDVHGNTGPTSIITHRETTSAITYTGASL